MSGDLHIYLRLDTDEVLTPIVYSELCGFRDFLNRNDRYAAAREIDRLIIAIDLHREFATHICEIGERVTPLVKAVEWTMCADSSIDYVDTEYKKLLSSE